MAPTIYDVAKKASVSIATVSKVINNTGRISEPTRVKVLEAMKQLDYRPSVVASALTRKKTDTLGLLVPDISNPFFSEIARNIEDRAHERGLSVIICSTDYNEEKEKKYIDLLKRKQVDGFIISSGFKNLDLLKSLMDQNIPVAMLALDNPSINVNVISVDDHRGGYQATAHLLAQGHENIAYIGEDVRSSNIRIFGYREAHEDYSVPIDEENIVKIPSTMDDSREMTKKLLERPNPPTAIFAANDLLAIGVIQGAREKGLNVPEDLSVVGFDDTILATITVPMLTTVAQPINAMGNKIVDVLIEEIGGKKKVKERNLFTPSLIIRGTTGRPRNLPKPKAN
ncbi:LacI family DNA-binding transcriptional regulator [Pseudalkalibacillus sp. R45]|uniref:LacI family DNA-binding transcriptional regulator n=1 Tax=Pseudalkalibacillus sp. R45 TaxID=3457433 RepID=UPI003FCE8E66